MFDPQHDDLVCCVVDPVQDPVRSAARCPDARKVVTQWFADSLGIAHQRGGDELHDRGGHRLWQRGGDGPSGRWGDHKVVGRQGSSRTKAANGIHAANHITAGICGVGLSDVGECFGIAEDVEGLFELGEILGTDQHGSRMAVAGHDDPFVVVFHPVDHLAEVVPHIAQGVGTHGHNCGAPCHQLPIPRPTSDSSHTAIQPQTTTDAIVTRTTISTSVRSGEVERWWRGKSDGHVRGHSVETELVALDVLHHEARLVVAIGRQ